MPTYCQTCDYLPDSEHYYTFSPYQFILLGEQRHVCVNSQLDLRFRVIIFIVSVSRAFSNSSGIYLIPSDDSSLKIKKKYQY